MDKRIFKTKFLKLLEQDVIGLSSEKKIKCMKKWITEYEPEHHRSRESVTIEDLKKRKVI